MNVLAVIARYKEDIDWVKKLEIPYLVVNKGSFIKDKEISKNTVNITNDINGRESHSYFWYIVHNYNNLPDKVIFLQGDPFTHQPDIFEILKADKIQNLDKFTPLSRFYTQYIPPPVLRHCLGTYYVNGVECWHGYSDDNMSPIIPVWVESHFRTVIGDHFKKYINDSNHKLKDQIEGMSLREILCRYYEIPFKPGCASPLFLAALFSVDKELILTRSIDYYKRLLKHTTETMAGGYCIERLWHGIFSCEMNFNLEELKRNI